MPVRRGPYVQILLVFVAFAVMASSCYVFMRGIVEAHLDKEARDTLSNIEGSIAADLKEIDTMLNIVSETVRDMLERGADAETMKSYIKYITDHMYGDKTDIPGFIAVFAMFDVFDGMGYNGLGIEAPAGYVPEDRPWFIAAEKAQGYVAVTEPYIDAWSGETSITFARCLYDDGGNKMATVCIDVQVDRLEGIAGNSYLTDKYNYSVLFDANLNIMAHPDKTLIGSPLRTVDSGFSTIADNMETGINIATRRPNFNGEMSVIYTRRLTNGWHVGVVASVDEYYRDISNIGWFLAVIGIVMSALLSGFLIRVVSARKTAEEQMLKAKEEKDTLTNLVNILNGLDALILVTVPETSEILFMNDNMKKHFGLNGDCVGQLCYKVFKTHADEQCEFCPCRQLDNEPDLVINWEGHNKTTDKTYRNSDRYIDWPDGRVVHLQHSVDITDIKNAADTLDKRLEQQALMTLVSQSFSLRSISDESLNVLITNAFWRIGEFMEAAQILLFMVEEDGDTFTCRNEWTDGESAPVERAISEFRLSKAGYLPDLFREAKAKNRSWLTSDDPMVKEAMRPYRINFRNYLFTPIFLEDKLYALLYISRRDENRKWSQDDLNMASFASNILTGAFQRHTAARQTLEAKEAAEQSNRSKSIFLASMSHEIRTPLNVILGIAEIELQDKELPPDIEESFSKIYDSGDLLLNIINDILDFSKIEAGKLELMPVKYDMPSLLHDTVQIILMRYESKPLTFDMQVDANTPLNLFGDELRIKQILSNLLSNAFKYTDEGRVGLSVSAEYHDSSLEDAEVYHDVTLTFRVSDTGQGLTAEQLGRIFDEYTRFNMQTNRSTVGTGLGMNITKRFIDVMGGRILVESEPGVGSVFTVRLPQRRMDSEVCGPELVDKLQLSHWQSAPKAHKTQVLREYMPYGGVLIVDDVESNLYVAKGLMSPYGLNIETVKSGFAAIEKIKGGKVYDIIFMDHMMPHMNGIEATQVIRDMDYTGPIVALTANAVTGQAEMFLTNGFDGFLSKPIDLRELNAMLNNFIRNRQAPEVIEAARQKKKELSDTSYHTVKPSDEIDKAFIWDADKTVAVMDEMYHKLNAGGDADLQLYIVSVHGIKAALNTIGETELSRFALKLEQAGREKNIALLLDETPEFLKALKALVLKKKLAKKSGGADAVDEDRKCLLEQMTVIKTACAVFDKQAAKIALEDLRQKQWSRQTLDKLDAIEEHLLHSAFKKALAAAEAIAAGLG